MVVASKCHVLHFSLSVLPVKFFGGVYDPIILVNQNIISKMGILLMDIKIPKYSLVIAGHLHWLYVKLPEIYEFSIVAFKTKKVSNFFDVSGGVNFINASNLSVSGRMAFLLTR